MTNQPNWYDRRFVIDELDLECLAALDYLGADVWADRRFVTLCELTHIEDEVDTDLVKIEDKKKLATSVC